MAKSILWILVGLGVALLLSPDTIVKIMTIYWLGLVGVFGVIRLVAWYMIRKGAVTITWTNKKGNE